MTALAVPEGLEPLAVWDTRERAWLDDHDRWVERIEWAKANIPDAGSTYRVEFALLDAPFAIVYRHARNDEGRVIFDVIANGPATDPPVIVPLTELPAARLLTS